MRTKKAPSQQENIETAKIQMEVKATRVSSASGEYKKVCQQIDRMRTIAKRTR